MNEYVETAQVSVTYTEQFNLMAVSGEYQDHRVPCTR